MVKVKLRSKQPADVSDFGSPDLLFVFKIRAVFMTSSYRQCG